MTAVLNDVGTVPVVREEWMIEIRETREAGLNKLCGKGVKLTSGRIF